MKAKFEKLFSAALELIKYNNAVCHRYSLNGVFYSDTNLWSNIIGWRSELLQICLFLLEGINLKILKEHRSILIKTEQTEKRMFVIKLVDLITGELIKEKNYRGILPESPNQFPEYWFLLLEDISINEDEPGRFKKWVCEPCEILEQEIT